MSNPIKYVGAGAGPEVYDVVPGQRITVIALNANDDITLNLPAVFPGSLGRSFGLFVLVAPGASIALQPASGEQAALLSAGMTPGVDQPLKIVGAPVVGFSAFLSFDAVTGVEVNLVGWVGTSIHPSLLVGVPNDGSDLAPLPIVLGAVAGRHSDAVSAVGRTANQIIFDGAAGGDYTGGTPGATGGAGTSIGSVAGAGGNAVGTDGDGGPGGSGLITAGNGGIVVGGAGNGGLGGGVLFNGGAGGSITGGGAGNGGASSPGGLLTGAGGDTDGTGNGGDSGVVSIGSGAGGNALGGSGGVGGSTGDVGLDVGVPGAGDSGAGAPGVLSVGGVAARDIRVGQVTTSRVRISRLAEFDSTFVISGNGTLRQYDLNVIQPPGAGTQTLTLPTLTGNPSQDGMACRLFVDATVGGAAITVVADTGAGDTALAPAITAAATVEGTSMVFRAYGTRWFLESQAN